MILTLKHIEAAYEPLRNVQNQQQMEQYMKHQFPFLGIKKAAAAPIIRQLFKDYELPVGEELKLLVQNCFLKSEREYHYFAMKLLNKQKQTLTTEDFPFVESLIIQHSWWDSIDDLSPNVVGHLVLLDRPAGEARMRCWIQCDNFWVQRAGLLHQLKYKEKMNESLLREMIEVLIDEKEFFIRKAIGWVLREYSKTNASFVVKLVEDLSLSPLSHKEAMKWLNNKSTPQHE